MKSNQILYGYRAIFPLTLMWMRILYITWRQSGSLRSFILGSKKILEERKRLVNANPVHKIIKVGGKYFWNMNAPAWPSLAFDRFFEYTVSQLRDGKEFPLEKVRFVMLAITKKCPLNCEHCYEWDEINKKETLNLDQLLKIVQKYQHLGASYFLLGGGEPLVRFNDLLQIVKNGHKRADFWISTSAYDLSLDKALQLKNAGLRGVSISLDHHQEEMHNAFRGNPKSFKNVTEGVRNALQAGLAVGLSICTTKSFISHENLIQYADLAKRMGVGFIQLLEPRAVGRYAGKAVQLLPEHYQVLDEFYHLLNHHKKYRDFPLIINISHKQREYGCNAAGMTGMNSIMIDTDGYLSACPFCRSKTIHALDEHDPSGNQRLKQEGCHKFENRIEKEAMEQIL